MMRIACIAASQIPSHTANSIQVMKVSQAIRGLGNEVCLWLPDFGTEAGWDELSKQYGLEHEFEIRWLRTIARLRRYDFSLSAVREARKWGADLLYIWPPQAAGFASRLGLPTVFEAHDRPMGRLGPRWVAQFLRGRGAKRILPTTDRLRKWLEVRYGMALSPPFAIVSPNGVDLARYADLPSPSGSRAALGLEDRFTAGYTGHLYPGRGIDIIIELARRNRDIQFLMAGGESSAVSRWQKRITDGHVENVRMFGFISNDDLPLYQGACDVLLMPYARQISVSSGGDSADFASPMKVFEYLAAGRAILSSDLPVLREILNEENSILIPPESVDSWNETLLRVRDNDADRQRLSSAAREDAKRYSWDERARRSLEGLFAA
jgi:glycosyltransferase involved in cell wall biosynthesis